MEMAMKTEAEAEAASMRDQKHRKQRDADEQQTQARSLMVRLWLPRQGGGGAVATRANDRQDTRDQDGAASIGATTPQRATRREKRARVSEEDGGEEEGAGSGCHRHPRRKPFYVIRKEAKEALLDELPKLERRAAELRRQAGLPSPRALAAVQTTQRANAALWSHVRYQHLLVGSMQSTLSEHVHSQRNALSTEIHLGKDMALRRQHLLSMRREKLDFGRCLIAERLRFVADRREYNSVEKYVTAEGDHTICRLRVMHFHGARSVKQVFDALRQSWVFLEMKISETLGQITTREDIDDCAEIDPGDGSERFLSNERLVTAFDSRITQEMNAVYFSEYQKHSAHTSDGSEYGVVVKESVASDDLHPYSPHCVRKDFAAAFTLSSFRQKRSQRVRADPVSASSSAHEQVLPLRGKKQMKPGGPDDEELVVVLKRCGYQTVRRPHFDTPEETLEVLLQNSEAWSSVLVKSIHDAIDENKGVSLE